MTTDGGFVSTDFGEVSQARFDAFVGYCRAPEAAALAHELAWFGAHDDSVFATIIVDTDGEFSSIVFLPDRHGRFRWAGQTAFYDTEGEARNGLHQILEQVLPELDVHREQGDEIGAPIDFFAPLATEDRLHASYRKVRDERDHSSAREIINLMMRWHEDVDGNFIEQFQTTGFDARVWELYVWATLLSLGYGVTSPQPSPDFIARGLDGAFAVEATTVNPSFDRAGNVIAPFRPTSDEELRAYADHYLPIRFAGPLRKKLAKRYWERREIGALPLVFAIQDFHADFSMTHSVGGLMAYLFGVSVFGTAASDGSDSRMTTHTWGTKSVSSRFFELPESENVSAVFFNSQGTLPKFSRMGIRTGFTRDDVKLLHEGTFALADDAQLELAPFLCEVVPDYWEEWISGAEVFHNPHAIRPLDPMCLPGAVHHFLGKHGKVESLYPPCHITQARTLVVRLNRAGGS